MDHWSVNRLGGGREDSGKLQVAFGRLGVARQQRRWWQCPDGKSGARFGVLPRTHDCRVHLLRGDPPRVFYRRRKRLRLAPPAFAGKRTYRAVARRGLAIKPSSRYSVLVLA